MQPFDDSTKAAGIALAGAISPQERDQRDGDVVMLEMNDAVRSGSVVLCDDSPHPDAITHDAAHPVRIRASDGSETHGVHDVSTAAYRGYNRHLVQRSELVAGLFENGTAAGL